MIIFYLRNKIIKIGLIYKLYIQVLCNSNPCKNNGICILTDNGGESCLCPYIFKGPLCEITSIGTHSSIFISLFI